MLILSMLQLRKLSPRNALEQVEKIGQCRQLSVVILGEISYKCAWLPFWQDLLKHRSVSKEMAMFVDGMAITK